MKRAMTSMLAALTIANAYGCESSSALLEKLRRGSFSAYVHGDVTLKALGPVQRDRDPVCAYGLTLIMPNQHGVTRLLVTDPVGNLRGTYELTLAEFVGLRGTTVLVRNSVGRMETVDLGEAGLPSKVFFDSELSELFLPR